MTAYCTFRRLWEISYKIEQVFLSESEIGFFTAYCSQLILFYKVTASRVIC